MSEWLPCGRGVSAAEDGHEGTCAEASGWGDLDGPDEGGCKVLGTDTGSQDSQSQVASTVEPEL